MKEEKKMDLSLDSYKGTRDFYPEDQFIQNYMFRIMRGVVRTYGYEEYNASLLEETALYRAKSGDEIANEQTYSFIDRGGREVTIRPEMTPTVARMVAKRLQELAFPLRWYSIPNLFRYERPQRGRLREHWQLNVDIFGAEGLEADIEAIQIAYDIMKAFGADDNDFEIRINNRAALFAAFPEGEAETYISLLDKKAKLTKDEFKKLCREKIGKEINERSFGEGDEHTEKTIRYFQEKGIKNVVYDKTLVRGFSYYTGMVFEVYDTNPKNPRSLFGGGRYDNLLSIFGKPPVPAVGFGVGDVTMRDFLEVHKLLPEYRSDTQVYLCRLGDEAREYAAGIADALRKVGISVAVDYTDRKVSAQIKTALKKAIPFFACVGTDEMKEKSISIKDLKKGKEYKLDIEGVIETIKRETESPV